MAIDFTCPHCGRRTNVAEEFAGHSGPCGGCGKTVTVLVPGAAPRPSHGPDFQSASAGASAGGVTWGCLAAVLLGVALLGGGVWALLFFPAVPVHREAARRAQCNHNLRQIGVALQNYYQTYSAFPPAVTTDKQGRPMHSWRVLLLPFLEERGLYQQYDLSQPWDSPTNARLTETVLSCYRCPSDPPQGSPPLDRAAANYVMVVGEGTLGGKPNETVASRDVPDGLNNTVAVVEVTGLGIKWSEPRDITVDELLGLVAAGDASRHPGIFQVLFADGSTRVVSENTHAETLRAMLLRNDGKAIPEF